MVFVLIADANKLMLSVSPVELSLVILQLSAKNASMIELSQKMDSLVTVLWELLRKMKFVSLVVKAVRSVLQLMYAHFAHFQQILKLMDRALVLLPTSLLNKPTNCCA